MPSQDGEIAAVSQMRRNQRIKIKDRLDVLESQVLSMQKIKDSIIKKSRKVKVKRK